MTTRSLTPLAGLIAGLFLFGPGYLPAAHASETAAVQAATTPAPATVLAVMERVADWQLAHPTGYPAEDWTEGVGDAGFMALAGN